MVTMVLCRCLRHGKHLAWDSEGEWPIYSDESPTGTSWKPFCKD